MSNEARNKVAFMQLYTDVFNQGKLSLAEDLFAEDFIDHEVPPGVPERGLESVRQLVTLFRNTFPDLTFRVEELIAEGETGAARVVWTGTHRGTWAGVAPTGRAGQQKQMHFMHFRDDKMIEHLAVRDDLGLRQQFGAIPAPAGKP